MVFHWQQKIPKTTIQNSIRSVQNCWDCIPVITPAKYVLFICTPIFAINQFLVIHKTPYKIWIILGSRNVILNCWDSIITPPKYVVLFCIPTHTHILKRILQITLHLELYIWNCTSADPNFETWIGNKRIRSSSFSFEGIYALKNARLHINSIPGMQEETSLRFPVWAAVHFVQVVQVVQSNIGALIVVLKNSLI
jgi:hypothetical protein